jgi:prolipoprotein diacylglyceryltransferase
MIAFEIFGFSVYRYGIFYFISFLIGYGCLAFVGKQEWFHKFPALQHTLTTNLDYLFIFLLLGVLVGGRLGHVFIYDLGGFIGNR